MPPRLSYEEGPNKISMTWRVKPRYKIMVRYNIPWYQVQHKSMVQDTAHYLKQEASTTTEKTR